MVEENTPIGGSFNDVILEQITLYYNINTFAFFFVFFFFFFHFHYFIEKDYLINIRKTNVLDLDGL